MSTAPQKHVWLVRQVPQTNRMRIIRPDASVAWEGEPGLALRLFARCLHRMEELNRIVSADVVAGDQLDQCRLLTDVDKWEGVNAV